MSGGGECAFLLARRLENDILGVGECRHSPTPLYPYKKTPPSQTLNTTKENGKIALLAPNFTEHWRFVQSSLRQSDLPEI